jgi:hypothetical protein
MGSCCKKKLPVVKLVADHLAIGSKLLAKESFFYQGDCSKLRKIPAHCFEIYSPPALFSFLNSGRQNRFEWNSRT